MAGHPEVARRKVSEMATIAMADLLNKRLRQSGWRDVYFEALVRCSKIEAPVAEGAVAYEDPKRVTPIVAATACEGDTIRPGRLLGGETPVIKGSLARSEPKSDATRLDA